MKKIIFGIALTLISSATFAARNRSIALPSDWAFIVCRQMENGGMTIQRRHLEEGANVTISAPAYETPVYEVYVDGNLISSCRFLTIKK